MASKDQILAAVYANGVVPFPNGCGRCGFLARGHAEVVTELELAPHVWLEPSQDVIKARMLSRRSASLSAAGQTGGNQSLQVAHGVPPLPDGEGSLEDNESQLAAAEAAVRKAIADRQAPSV